MLADAYRVRCHMILSGVHSSEHESHAPLGKNLTNPAVGFIRIAGGTLLESDAVSYGCSRDRQLEAVITQRPGPEAG